MGVPDMRADADLLHSHGTALFALDGFSIVSWLLAQSHTPAAEVLHALMSQQAPRRPFTGSSHLSLSCVLGQAQRFLHPILVR